MCVVIAKAPVAPNVVVEKQVYNAVLHERNVIELTCSNAPVIEPESDQNDYQRSFLDAFKLY